MPGTHDSPLAHPPKQPHVQFSEAVDVRDVLIKAQDDDLMADNTNLDSEDEAPNGLIINDPPRPRKISDKRRIDDAIFAKWIEENQSRLEANSKKSTVSCHDVLRPLAKRMDLRIIDKAREYQVELFERAKQQNTIAVLDTGSGKTLIAALLVRWVIEQELEDRAHGQPKRIVFFLVDKVVLVDQQHRVLTANLDYPVEKLCGELLGSQSSKEFWMRILEENMAVVLTADILNQCLHHSFLRMEQINLIVFDEAHHVKGNHPYATIIKRFYAELKESERRPRILGITASPVDAKRDPLQAAAELEALMHSKIATTDDPLAAKNTTQEEWVQYDALRPPIRTPLTSRLSMLLGGHKFFQKPLLSSARIAGHLGFWCSNRFWQLFFEEEGMKTIEAKTERDHTWSSINIETLDDRLQEVRNAREAVRSFPLQEVTLDRTHLSGKVVILIGLLETYFSKVESHYRCIVFVQERNTAVLLADLLQQPGMKIPGLQAGILVGGGKLEGGASKKVSFRHQAQIISQFRDGELNCLFATSVAEEGLDIPDCNVIIRFDMGATLIQYIQSRGRARQDNSVYIHMIEQGNLDHKRRAVENEAQEKALRQLCSALPEDRKLTGNDFNMDYFLKKEKGQLVYKVPSTGAKLTFRHSLVCLAAFTASLQQSAEESLSPTYCVFPVSGGFQCEVTMPNICPVKTATGTVRASKAVAKCAAAFAMCLLLIKGRYIDEHLQPAFARKVNVMRNARLAVSSKKRADYPMRLRPSIWSNLGVPDELYGLVLFLSQPDALYRKSAPLVLLTRAPLPQLPPCSLFFAKGQSSQVNFVPFSKAIKVEKDTLDNLTSFTLRIFHDVFSKEYVPDRADEKLPYFLAPLSVQHGHDFMPEMDLHALIDWAAVEYAARVSVVDYKFFDEPEDFFVDKFVTDQWDGSRKFFIRRRRPDMKPTDEIPEGVPLPKNRIWKAADTKRDILNYSVSLWSKSRTKFMWREDQPVVEAELQPMRRNLLDDAENNEGPRQCFLILEPLCISPLSAEVVAMAYNFPAIIHRIDSHLIALDACHIFDLDIQPGLALEAMTKDSDNTDEHEVTKINFQGGMGNNYERLEFLGDSFLKMATTISVHTLVPDSSECDSHVERMLLICNQNLFNNALNVYLQEFVRSQAFSRRTWYPTNLEMLRGKQAATDLRHQLADKSIADVCEALIGAAYLSTRDQENPFDLAVKAVKAMVKNERHPMTRYADYYAAYHIPEWQCASPTTAQLEMTKKFAARMGYTFKYPPLLRCAFSHPTYSTWKVERLPSYQRLEFLGDALYDMVCVDYLFHRFPTKDPGWLTEHKMAMVSNQFLGCLAASLNFHKAVLHTSPFIQKDIQNYVEQITLAKEAAEEDAVREGKLASAYARDYWQQCPQPPKCLADVVEAYVGAMFVDSEYNYSTVQSFFDTHVLPYFEDMHLYDTFASKHPVTLLTSLLQTEFHCSDWRIMCHSLEPATLYDQIAQFASERGDGAETKVACCVMIHGEIVTSAVSASGRYGKSAAAKKAIEMVRGMTRDKFRAKFRCSCIMKDIDSTLENHPSEGTLAKGVEQDGTAI